MDLRTVGESVAVSAVIYFYIAWRIWNLRLAIPRPGTKLAAMTEEQRRTRLRKVAARLCVLGTIWLGGGIWLWLRSGG
jgi:hypothetical protein